VAVASAGPYASLHLTPDRQPRQHPTTRFLQAGCPSCRPTNSVKALKASRIKQSTGLNIYNWQEIAMAVKVSSGKERGFPRNNV